MAKSNSLTWVTKVKSSMIRQAAYNPKHNVLFLEFNNGVIFKYDDVPFCIFEEFSMSESQGKYFHSDIKGNFDGSKMEPHHGHH